MLTSKRIYGIDFGKGLAVAGMLFAHTFEGGICDWEYDVEMKYLSRVPSFISIIGAPVMLICLMGLFFTYLTSMTCIMSMIRIEKKGDAAVISYLFYRFAFALVLKAVELVMSSWWREYGVFSTMTLSLPKAAIDREGGTLDSVGFCGFFVPFLVFLVRKIPRVKENVFHQVAILTIFACSLLLGYNKIADVAITFSTWCFKNEFNLLGTFFSKVGSGPFMLAQCVPFGIIGGALSLLIIYNKEWKYLCRYCCSLIAFTLIVTVVFFLSSPNPFEELVSERKPYFLRFLELCFETCVCVLVLYYTDNENRPIDHRYSMQKDLTPFRRISCVSLSAFIYEMWVSRQLRKVFAVFVGQPYDPTTKEIGWSLWTVLFFMVINFIIDLFIICEWEKIHFNFSCEHLIANILSYIFGRKEAVNWKENNDKVIYGPNKELEAEILSSKKEIELSTTSVQIQLQNVDI